ncbi:hypothetical protein LOK49_LG07G00080 [Camellia lanceoleosa]|uniref:Uncharacterized protein n=1 Tax=Camellia lanceoleosa TaxID=1840588 RepID=A0ACC0H726_9ERIC|nr:hypothetical protein LOK49_LG07G00080 [Camellia lanceoleosa]
MLSNWASLPESMEGLIRAMDFHGDKYWGSSLFNHSHSLSLGTANHHRLLNLPRYASQPFAGELAGDHDDADDAAEAIEDSSDGVEDDDEEEENEVDRGRN